MRSFHRLAVPLLGLVPVILPPGASARTLAAAPAGSFLHRQAHSVFQLVQEVQADPVVRRRFAHHFHIPEGQVAANFSHNLLMGKLLHDGTYTVFFVAGSGLIYPTRMALRPGTPVFVGRDRRPVLLAGTGDPLIPFVTAVEIRTIDGGPDLSTRPQEQVVPAAGADIPVPATASP